MNTPHPSRWPELFEQAMAIVDQANANGIAMSDWTFGGGTALMLQIGHRDSHDIDLFVSDAQYLPFLNPETQGFELGLVPSGYETDGTRALKIVFDGVGEVEVHAVLERADTASLVDLDTDRYFDPDGLRTSINSPFRLWLS